jgi:DNA end-binding protein Ku
MVDIAARIIEQTSGAFEPDKFEDRYEIALRELVEARTKGRTIRGPESPRDTKVVDLMAALKASLGRRVQVPAGGGTVVRLPARSTKRQKSRRPAKAHRVKG